VDRPFFKNGTPSALYFYSGRYSSAPDPSSLQTGTTAWFTDKPDENGGEFVVRGTSTPGTNIWDRVGGGPVAIDTWSNLQTYATADYDGCSVVVTDKTPLPMLCTIENSKILPVGGSAYDRAAFLLELFSDGFGASSGLQHTNSGAGSGVNATANPVANNNTVGVLLLSAGTANSGSCRVYSYASATTQEFSVVNMIFRNVWMSKAPDVTDDFKYYAGMFDGSFVDGCYFYIDRTVSATNWLCRTSSNGVNTTVDSGVAITTTVATGKKLEIKHTPETSSKFYIDGSLVATITTNLPRVDYVMGFEQKIIRTNGSATAVSAGYDLMALRGILTTPRDLRFS